MEDNPTAHYKKQYRRRAMLDWKKHTGRTDHILEKIHIIDNPFIYKKEYRRNAIIKWKKKQVRNMCNTNKITSQSIRDTNIKTNVTVCNAIQLRHKNRVQNHTLHAPTMTPDVLPDVLPCSFCGAFKFYSETSNFCCCEGRIILSSNTLPATMHNLLTSPTREAVMFRTYIRTYNNHFAFTSLGVKADTNLSKRNKGIYTFRVQGQMYHFMNDLQPQENNAKNLQLYFHDANNEVENRIKTTPRLAKDVIALCIDYLDKNPYARFFRNLSDIQSFDDYKIVLKTIPGQDQRVYNKPEVSQVAALWVEGGESSAQGERNIEVKTHSDESRSVKYYYGCYDPLQYPLMFPHGELGWHQHIPKKTIAQSRRDEPSTSQASSSISPSTFLNADQLLDMEESVLGDNLQTQCVSVREYYAYKLQIRKNDRSCMLIFGRLLQQYIVDNYVKLETQRLAYFRGQQPELRQEFLQGVVDAMANGETHGAAIGTRIVLPANFIGGPRNMRRKYIDAMALVQKFGKPDLFVTMTCNPNWPEIKHHMMNHEEAQNRPDLCVRVFHAKLELFKDEILRNKVFGNVVAYTYVVEFQKRGLPHAHFLLILAPNSRMYHAEEYDEIVSAEIPDKNINPHLFHMVKRHMLHGPCGTLNPDNICMKKTGSCKNFYPKEFSEQTTQNNDAYPTYRRRDNGIKVYVRGAYLDNKWVVPYNPYLLSKFNCHVNVEICSTIKAVKYIYKYICKGCDRISFSVSPNDQSDCVDEIERFQSGRWISPPEAAWRIFRFNLGDIKPAVIHLPVHLENYQPMTFKKREPLNHIVENTFRRKTMLTEFFVHNSTNTFAKHLNLTYSEFPDHFVWKSDKKLWSPRQHGDSIGRMVVAHPNEGERYYLRLLLSKKRCPKSYSDLRVCNGVIVDTFRESALLHGYLIDDNSQELCLEEATMYHMPYELRRLFATLLAYTTPNNPRKLWLTFEDAMIEDFYNHKRLSHREALYCAFQQINTFLQSIGKRIKEFHILPNEYAFHDFDDDTREIEAEKSIIISNEDLHAEGNLNVKQKMAFDMIIKTINTNKSRAFFIDGPGGTGKTYLYRALLAKIRSEGNIALATATSGIAASLLPGGRTAHSRFKIPIDLSEGMVCRIGKQSSLAKLIRSSKLIIWDEAPTAKRSTIEALDYLLRDLLDSTKLFGGKVVVFGGDFRQTLPVIRRGNRSETIAACLTQSFIWPTLYQIHLEENMRALLDPTFGQFLLRIGDGTQSSVADIVTLPTKMIVESNSDIDGLNILIDYVYPNIYQTSLQTPSSNNRAILTTKNVFVDEINALLVKKIPGDEFEYISYDETLDVNNQAQYEDLLHSLTPNGMPPHRLVLKQNAPIILLRNLNPTEGLCNGTRLFCKTFNRNVIHAEISFGEFAGKQVFIHRIPLQPPSGEQFTVPFKRMQFPIRLCFAMTINKAQGQTLDFVGIYLKEPVFSHGQLYVALSRAKSIENIKVVIKDSPSNADKNKTRNVVYREVFEYANH